MHLIVFSSPRAGMDEEYNTWYTEVHIPDMLEIPGVKSCNRFRAQPVGGQPRNSPIWPTTISTATPVRC